MADSDTARLCVQIIHSHFGPLAAKISSTLLTRGRLPLGQLIRYTKLKPRIIRACILVLIQHNILWHSETEDDGEVLEINVDECLERLRFGFFVWLAEELFGQVAGEIVQTILDHGKLRPPEIISQVSLYDSKKMASAAQAIHKLVTSSYLKPSTVLSHHSPRDKFLKYEAEERAKISGLPTAKELRNAKEIAGARLKREEEALEKIGLKRNPKEKSTKRSTKNQTAEDEIVDDEIYFRVNYSKFNIHIRNQIIEAAVRERYNNQAALVMRCLLKVTEQKQLTVGDNRSDPCSIANIAMQLPEDEDLALGLALPASSKRPTNISLVKEYIGMLAAADDPSPTGRANSFVSLGSNKVQVEFEIICRRLRRRALEAVTRERHGDQGVRVLRLLLDTGKMDEKQISKVAMMAAKDARPLLSALSIDSLIATQEVPKSADRNPTRTFYLWYVDLHKAYSVLLGNLYKTLYNISKRRQAEEQEPVVKAVLEKRSRSDVSEDETLLTRAERDILREWERKREKLDALEIRVGEAVFVLRDMGVFGVGDD